MSPSYHRGRSRSLGRSRTPRRWSHNDDGGGFYPTTPKLADYRSRHPPHLRVYSDEEEAYRRRSRSVPGTKRGGSTMKQNLLLPTLCSPDPDGMRLSSPMRKTRSQSPSPRHHHRNHFGAKVLQPVVTKGSSKPNHLLPYSPRRGYKATHPPTSFSESRPEMRSRPAPLSRFVSEPLSSHGLPQFSPRQYSPSLASKMASLHSRQQAIPIAPHHHPYGGVSLTPKSLHEQDRFGFNSYDLQQRSSGRDQYRRPISQNFEPLTLAQHQTLHERMNMNSQAAMAQQQQQYADYMPAQTRPSTDFLSSQPYVPATGGFNVNDPYNENRMTHNHPKHHQQQYYHPSSKVRFANLYEERDPGKLWSTIHPHQQQHQHFVYENDLESRDDYPSMMRQTEGWNAGREFNIRE